MNKFVTFLAILLLPLQAYCDDSTKDIYTTVAKDKSLLFDQVIQAALSHKIHDIGISHTPNIGQVMINADKSITYIPKIDACAQIDEFSYYFVDDEGTHTHTIFVEILCEDLTIINGFSLSEEKDPNTFTILGIENFPNNTLYVFNANGNKVYYKEGYQNDWNGQMAGKELSDELYYYVLNDGAGHTYSGYLKLNQD